MSCPLMKSLLHTVDSYDSIVKSLLIRESESEPQLSAGVAGQSRSTITKAQQFRQLNFISERKVENGGRNLQV